MLKFINFLKIIPCLACLLLISQTLSAQQTDADFQSKTIKYGQLISTVEKDPDNISKHDAFIRSFDINDPFLRRQYLLWEKKFPSSANIPFALGKAFYNNSDGRSRTFLLKAVAINPHIAEAWMLLSQEASLRGEEKEAREFIAKAVQEDPANASYAMLNADLYEPTDTVRYNALMSEIALRFSGKTEGAQACYWLASASQNKDTKEHYYKKLFNSYLNNQNDWFRAGMIEYYDMLVNESRYKEAQQVATDMVNNLKTNRLVWKQRLTASGQLTGARQSLDSNNFENARQLLSKVDLGNPNIYEGFINAQENVTIFRAEIEDAGNNTRSAYDTLKLFYGQKPSDQVYKHLATYARKLGIDSNKISEDVATVRAGIAWKATNFTLENHVSKKKVSLADYRGKVVLLTYWFPSCGPCKAEFPHFEAVLKKFKKEDVVYLAINLGNHEEEYIKPTINSGRFTFTPLRDSPDHKAGNLPQVFAAPTNFLFDKNGRVIFSGFRINGGNERSLELMISELLNQPQIN